MVKHEQYCSQQPGAILLHCSVSNLMKVRDDNGSDLMKAIFPYLVRIQEKTARLRNLLEM